MPPYLIYGLDNTCDTWKFDCHIIRFSFHFAWPDEPSPSLIRAWAVSCPWESCSQTHGLVLVCLRIENLVVPDFEMAYLYYTPRAPRIPLSARCRIFGLPAGASGMFPVSVGAGVTGGAAGTPGAGGTAGAGAAGGIPVDWVT